MPSRTILAMFYNVFFTIDFNNIEHKNVHYGTKFNTETRSLNSVGKILGSKASLTALKAHSKYIESSN